MEHSLYSPFYQSEGICIDTRKRFNGCLFVCIQGANFDGNTFAEDALKQGAHHVIVDNPDYYSSQESMTLVEDSVRYLQQLANHHRKTFSIPVIGITGSNGKTTTKELINSVLKKKYNVLATEGNLNNHIGVPLTLLQLKSEHEIAIIEMGANRLKDIEELSEIAEPDYGIITNIGKAHLEGFGSFEGVLTTKKELYTSVSISKGTLLVNGDDDLLVRNTPPGIPLVTYGEKADNNVRGELVNLSPFIEMKWSHDNYESDTFQGNMIGKYNFYNYLAAAAFGVLFKVPDEKITAALQEYKPTNNRSQVMKSEKNTLILDCYNANPTSMKSALESFHVMNAAKKVFVIGDMRELGQDSDEEHRNILKMIETFDLDGYTVGEEFGKINSDRVIRHFEDVEQAREYFSSEVISDTLILLKGSRGVALEKLIDIF